MNPKNIDEKPQLKSAIDLKALALKALEAVYGQFTNLWTPVQVLLAICGLALALYFGNELRVSLLNTPDNFAKSLETKQEPTRNADPGITSVVSTPIKDEDWGNAEHLDTRELNSILEAIIAKVQELTKQVANLTDSEASKLISKVIDRLNLKVISIGSPATGSFATWKTAITSERKESFVAVPALSIRNKTLNELPLNGDNRPRLEEVLKYNSEIWSDLLIASELEPLLMKMDSASGQLLKIVQTYFISESGTFFLRASGVNAHDKYFKDEFQPYTNYVDRPYFWGAIDPKGQTKKPHPFDYVTKPYIDLGGNGFVVTFSKKLDLPNHRVGVVCVDAKLPDYVTDKIVTYLKNLGAKVSDFYCSEGTVLEPAMLPPEFSWFQTALSGSREAKSRVLGAIATEPVKMSSTQSQNEYGRVVRFTVPVNSHDLGEGKKKTRLLWVEFDSASILKTLTKDLGFFIAGIILVVAVTWSLFRDYTVLKREMSNVLEKMSKVMQDASTPFAWMNEKNEFHKVNNSLLRILGYANIEELKKETHTFRGLVTSATQHTYDSILSKSGADQETGEYEIDIITKTGKVLRVRAHGERIPYPTFWRRGLPHRFGIFVEVTEPMPTFQHEPAGFAAKIYEL